MNKKLAFLVAVFVCTVFRLPSTASAEEGMWLFNAPPVQQVKENYGFELTPQWLDHVRLSSVRFARRGSASFVSPQGLILTNHHVGARNLHELSTPENDLLTNGFYAKTLAEELPCDGLEVIVLMDVRDVTKEVEAVAKPEMSAEDAQKARGAFMATLEKETAEKTGLRCEVMTLFQGGVYHLYCYKVYTDVRLVWAPENAIASFGGDPDNYEYPRYCLDASFFRAYEDGKPAKTEHYLKWCTDGVKDGELVFVSGHPGTTNRAFTKEHLEYMRDVYFPHRLDKLFRREVVYAAYGNRSLENQRRIANDLSAVQNYRKRAIGQLDGLQTPSLWDGKLSAEGKPENSPEAKIAAACRDTAEFYPMYDFIEGGEAFNSQTFRIARTLVRLAAESEKPNAERLKEYRDGNLESLKASLFSEAPIYEDVEILKLTDSLTMLYRYIGQSNIPLQKSPKEWAVELVTGSKLRDVAERKRLAEGGMAAIEASDDPMIRFARDWDENARVYRKEYETKFEAPLQEAYAELAKRRFDELGTSVYPDATLTLRLSYGSVKGYKEDDGTDVAPITNIAGMYDRAAALQNKEPFDPPQSWKDGRATLDMDTAFNLVTTNDIIGGNSGSPLVNAKGEIVGLVFDGNIYSLSNNFVYTDTQSRCVSVHVDVILEALRKIYKADRLVEELLDR